MLAQSPGTSPDIQGSGSSPVIVPDRPQNGSDSGQTIRGSDEALVQIRGAWASDSSACAAVEERGETGLYITDTLIRWEGATCNIRNIDAEENTATLYTLCAEEDGRRERTFRLESSAE